MTVTSQQLLVLSVTLLLGLASGYALVTTVQEEGPDDTNPPPSAENTPPQVTLLAPSHADELEGPVELVWFGHDAQGDPLTYTLHWWPRGGQAMAARVSDLVTTRYTLEELTPGQTYYWNVTASDGQLATASPIYSFTLAPLEVVPNAHPNVELLLPSDGDVVAEPVLTWFGYDSDEDPLNYDLLLDTNPAPQAVVAQGLISTTFTPEGLAPSTFYYWQVVAFDGQDRVSSPIYSFSIPAPVNAPPTVRLLLPAEEALVTDPVLTWFGHDADEDTLTYDLYLDTDPEPTLLVGQALTTTTFTPSSLEYSTLYFWQVVAHDAQHQAESPVWSFTLGDPEISPSERSVDSYDEADQLLADQPLATEPDFNPTTQQLSNAEQEADDITGNSPDPDWGPGSGELPEVNVEAGELASDLDSDPDDLSQAHGGPSAYTATARENGDFTTAFGEVLSPEGQDPQFGNDSLAEFNVLFGNFQVRVGPDADNPGPARTSYHTLAVQAGDAYDNNSDDNPEYVNLRQFAYALLGNETDPEYESFYAAQVVIIDNNSDGNPELVTITQFGYESYDGDGDGVVEYAALHLRTAVAIDNDSDGNPELGNYSAAGYVRWDGDSDGSAEFEAGSFEAVLVLDPDSDGNASLFSVAKWTFAAANGTDENNTAFSLQMVRGEQLVSYDNTSDGNPEYARYSAFGAAHATFPEGQLSWVTATEVVTLNPNSSANAEFVRLGHLNYLNANSTEGNYTLAEAAQLTLYDNNTDGNPDLVHGERWGLASFDNNTDGNPEFIVVQAVDVVAYDNASQGDGNLSFVRIWALTYYAADSNGNGTFEADEQRFIVDLYVAVDEDQDGTKEREFHRHWDSGE